MDNNLPLVSVNVLAYNSSKYIIETLESIYAQTYQNIELVISDDKSTDNTVAICQKWIDAHRSRFANVQLLVPDRNTGQSGNYNRAFRAAKGEWIKEIDGDDLLLPNCVTDLVNFVCSTSDAKYVFGRTDCFGPDEELVRYFRDTFFDYSFFNLSIDEQIEKLVFDRNCIPSQTVFYSRSYVDSLGFENDERIPYLEDWPKWIALLQKGVRFYFFDKVVTSYRISSGISTKHRMNYLFFVANAQVERYYLYPEWIKRRGQEYAFERIYEKLCRLYANSLEYEANLNRYLNYWPISFIRKIVYFLRQCKSKRR